MWNMPEGSYEFNELPELTQYSIIAMGILFASTFILFAASVVYNQILKNKLLKNGKEATAKIIRVYETGTTVNNSYLMGFELEVMPANAPKFTTTCEQLVSRLKIHEFQAGNELRVCFDPQSHQTMIVGKVPAKQIA